MVKKMTGRSTSPRFEVKIDATEIGRVRCVYSLVRCSVESVKMSHFLKTLQVVMLSQITVVAKSKLHVVQQSHVTRVRDSTVKLTIVGR